MLLRIWSSTNYFDGKLPMWTFTVYNAILNPACVVSGILQETVLGHPFFIIDINEVSINLQQNRLLLFADDSKKKIIRIRVN